MQICIVAECYGNRCVGEYLSRDVGGRVLHKPNYGRELILHSIAHELKPRCHRLIVIIDYETSRDARRLVEAHFELRQVCERVWIGHGKGKFAGVVAVVLDPHVEGFAERLGLNPGDKLKHEDACRHIRSELERSKNATYKFYECLQKLKSETKNLLARSA